MGSPARHGFDPTTEHVLRLMAEFEALGRPASTTELAKVLAASPSTVTTALRRLSDQGYLNYAPYQRPTLTEQGRRLGLRVSRKHRLVELMLVELLGMDWVEAHREAHSLEHAVSDNFATRIEEVVGKHVVDESDVFQGRTKALSSCEPGDETIVVSVTHESPDLLRELETSGIVPGVALRVEKRSVLSGALIVDIEGVKVPVDNAVAARITVRALEVAAP